LHLHAVAAGEDGRIGGAHGRIDQDAAPLGHGQAGCLGEAGIGAHAHGHDDQIGLDGALVRDHPFGLAVALDAGHLFGQTEDHAFFFHVLLGHARKPGARHAGKNLVEEFHHRDVESPHVGEGHGHFQTDEARAHNAGRAHGAAGHHLFDGVGRFQTVHGVDARQIDARNGQVTGRTAHGQDELVIRKSFFLAGIEVAHGHGLGRSVDGRGLGPGHDAHVLDIVEKLLVAQHVEGRGLQGRGFADLARDVKGNAASAVGNPAPPVDHGHAAVRKKPFDAAGGLGAECYRADDEDVFGHGCSFVFELVPHCIRKRRPLARWGGG